MVEIPEHLLERSREARARLTGDSGGGDTAPAADAAPAAEAPAEAESPAAAEPAPEPAPVVAESPAPAEPSAGALEPVASAPPPAPIVPEVPKVYAPASHPVGHAEKFHGARVPTWLMPVYIIVPLLFIALVMAFVNTAEEESNAAASAGPDGAALYSQNCASCHGPKGEGGVGPALDGVVDVFPDFKAHFEWVADVASETEGPFGNNGNLGKGAKKGAMPLFGKDFGGNLTAEELYAIVAHEREEFGGASPDTLPPKTDFGITETAGAEGAAAGGG